MQGGEAAREGEPAGGRPHAHAAVAFRNIGDVRPSPRNSRKHSPEQVMQIALSMLQWGWTMPALVDETGETIAGHGRVMAAALIYAGFEEPAGGEDGEMRVHPPRQIKMADGSMIPFGMVPVMEARGWSDTQKRAYIIADNKLTETSEWDEIVLREEMLSLHDAGFDLSLTGMTADDLQALSVGVEALPEMPELSDADRSPYREQTFILLADQLETIRQAIELEIPALPDDIGGGNRSGTALAAICRAYLDGRS